MNIKYSIFTLFLLLTAANANAETASMPIADARANEKSEPTPEIHNKGILGISIGYEHNFVSVFMIEDPNETDSESHVKAKFRGESSSPLLRISTGNLAPNDLHFQILIEAGYSEFELDKQFVDGAKTDLGTSIEGKHVYIMPQLLYNTSEIGVHPNKENGLRVGGGLGIGFLQASGSAIYTDPKTQSSANPDEIHTIDINSAGLSMKLFLEYRYYGLFIGTHFKYILANDDGNNTNSDYFYSLYDVGMSLGYSLYF